MDRKDECVLVAVLCTADPFPKNPYGFYGDPVEKQSFLKTDT